MATIGLDNLYYSKITENADGEEAYGTPAILAKAIDADLTVELLKAALYADDGVAEEVSEFKSGKISLGVADIGGQAASDLTGAQIDDNGVVVSQAENNGLYVAVGFRSIMSNGKYRYFWVYRVKFDVPGIKAATRGENITFQTPKIEGTIYRRKKTDAFGRHPWKAEVTEGASGVAASTISGWYSAVYEPATTEITISDQPADAEVTAGEITGSLTVAASAASGTLGYQWYSNAEDSNVGGTPIADATSASLTIPTTLSAGTYYYFCELSANSGRKRTDAAKVTVAAA